MRKTKQLMMVAAFLFIFSSISPQVSFSKDTSVYDQGGKEVGFVDSSGMYHELNPLTADSAAGSITGAAVAAPLQASSDVPITTDEFAWPMFQCNNRHNGYLPVTLDTDNFSLRWQKSISISSPVTAADGFVVFTSGATLYVLDAVDGDAMWSKSLSGYHVGHPSYGYGNVYIQTCNHSSDTWLHAFNATTGEYVFKSGTSAQWENYYSPTLFDGKAYINGGYYGGMYGYDASAGTRLWFTGLNQYDEWTPAVDVNYAYAYLGEYSPALYVLNRSTGTIAFSIPDPGFSWDGWSMHLAPVLGEMGDILAIHNGRLISFDLVNKKIGYQVSESFSGQPVVAKGQVYAINGGKMEARDEATGNLLWSWTPPEGSLTGYLALTDSHIFAGTSSNTYAIDLFSREKSWSYPAAGYLAIANDTLYIGSSSLTAIAAQAVSPSNPVSIEIQGPNQISENNQAQYQSFVTYQDGRIRNRTMKSAWTVDPNKWVQFDDRAFLHTKELINPSEHVTLTAVYTENDITLTGKKDVTIVADCNLTALAHRNLAKAIDMKKQILSLFDSSIEIERATAAICKPKRPPSFPPACVMPPGPFILCNKVYNEINWAIALEMFADKWTNSSLDSLVHIDANLPPLDQVK